MLVSREGVVLTRFRGEGLVLAGASTLKNEHTWLVFEGGENVDVGREQPPSFQGGGGVGEEQPPSKTSATCSFSRGEVVMVSEKHPSSL